MDHVITQLLETHSLRDAVIRQAVEGLDLPRNSHGLDAGCGLGLQFQPLLEAIGEGGHITGMDLSADLLGPAAALAADWGIAERVTLRQGDVQSLPFDDDCFDWAWSMDCIGYHPMDPLPPLRELMRVLRPGGRLALAMWSSQRLLPGYPLLEARLAAAPGGIASFEERTTPGQHYLRALGWFRELGLSNPRAETVLGSVQAPCTPSIRRSLELFFDMLWAKAQSRLSDDDRQTFRAITDPESPDFIVDSPDYFGFFTYSVFDAVVGRQA